LVCYDHQSTWLRERTDKDIWQHLWEFPLVETKEALPLENIVEMTGVSGWIGSAPILHTPVQIRHILSHQVIHATFLPITVVRSSGLTAHFVEVPLTQLDQMPVSRLTELFLLKYSFH
jgi:A/G-specific adenine glycosylase